MLQGAPTVFVVDDDRSVREALASLLGSVALRVECFASVPEFLPFRRPDAPACLVLDVRMAGLSGLDLQRQLAAQEEAIPIIFITAYGDIPMAVAAMKAGAVEFLPKPFRDHDLLDAVRRALERDRSNRVRREAITVLRKRHEHLTAREREVMARLAKGRLNKQIAADLGIGEYTVKAHRRRVMAKMRATTFAELVLMAERINGSV
jgi:FixJ family two-component response regulator